MKALRRAGQRWLHPWRRARARALVRDRADPKAILVVCQGNVCRSPFAAAVLARGALRAGRSVRSAGFIGPGREVPPNALDAARRWDVDLAGHRSQLVTPALLAGTDLVVVMEPWQATRLQHDYGWPARRTLLLGDLDPGPVEGRPIVDPWDLTLAEHMEVYARIVRCTGALHTLLAPAALQATVGRSPHSSPAAEA